MISSRAIVTSRSTGGRAASSSLPAATASVAAHDETAGDSAGLRVRRLGVELPIERSRWIALRVRGPGCAVIFDGPVRAHTNPVHVMVAGRRFTSRPDAESFVTWIEPMLRVVDARNRFARAEDRRRVESLLRSAQEEYREWADARSVGSRRGV
jgi:hypothetical protein